LEVIRTIAAPTLYRWERMLLFLGFIAPLFFLPSADWTLFANSASISCACTLVVEFMLGKKVYRKYQTNLALARKGWFAELSREFTILSFLGLCLGVYGALLWGFGQAIMQRLIG
jgi:hypothetical protein